MNAQKYLDEGITSHSNSVMKLWGLLDLMFVSHKEFTATYNNVQYLKYKQDMMEQFLIESGYNSSDINLELRCAADGDIYEFKTAKDLLIGLQTAL